jgi:hypothetical protein
MRELLAEDALAIASRRPPERQITQREFTKPLVAAAVALIGLLYLAIAGPGNFAYGVRHLWAGWAIPGLLPPQTIEVLPGDDGIRIGGSVSVRAMMKGFSPTDATVHASFGGDEWQQVQMADAGDEFQFTFFSVREPLRYYVSAADVRSQTYEVRVVDLPSIDKLISTCHFPEWTGREAETHDPGGDIRTIADTRVEIQVTSDGELPRTALVVDDESVSMSVDGNSGSGEFTVEQDGQYYVAALVGGEQIRLTDDFFIRVLEDEPPEIEFVRPGRDWSASSIEEVTARISAADDFRLDSLELRYSINGGDWEAIELPVDKEVTEFDHVFFLEELSARGDEQTRLVPGDLISYYAIATDRENSSRTDIFFVDVQPFDKRYTQSQQGGGGQMGGQQQDEISQRQKEIIVSTWNLIREQQKQRRADVAYVPDNSALLSRLQSTLKEQAETLAARTRARQLTDSDENIALFVEHLTKAAAAMEPAAQRLAEIDLEQAILPEQEALQHLLRAEAVFTDINVSMQANNRGRGGGQAGRDLSEMFEIEMDLEKNQYESGSSATPDAPQQMDEMRNELEELARRQEQLANSLDRSANATEAQRWQQEMLRREVEELRERLERTQQNASNNQSQSGSQSGQQSSGGQSGEQQSEQRQSDELQRRLDSALRAMREVDQAIRDRADREALQRASAEAQRQLEGARDRASEEQLEATQARLGDLSNRADDLYERQAALEERLQDAIRDVQVGTNEFNRLDSGMTFDEEYEMAQAKREIQKELQQLEQDAKSTSQQIEDSQPEAAAQLEEAIENLREMEVEMRLAVSAAYIEQGEAVYIAASDSAITEALRELERDLERAASMASENSGEGSGNGFERDRLGRTLADTRELRRNLQELSRGGFDNRSATNWGRDDLQQPTGLKVDDLDVSRELERNMDAVSDDVLNLFRELAAAGVPIRDLDEMRRLAAEVRASDFSGNKELLDRESQAALSLVEQLELALASAAADRDNVRLKVVDDIPENHRETVATYYRKLGESDSVNENQ